MKTDDVEEDKIYPIWQVAASAAATITGETAKLHNMTREGGADPITMDKADLEEEGTPVDDK